MVRKMGASLVARALVPAVSTLVSRLLLSLPGGAFGAFLALWTHCRPTAHCEVGVGLWVLNPLWAKVGFSASCLENARNIGLCEIVTNV
jgi:hypothetical protein